ncbi:MULTISPECIES: sulfotransferase [Nonomuraea]|jgi:hypothetical protein|uniref:Sulfotransferase n=1 Tax=Nonomuraea salmonea TaxID=46181 RepID=A0ABV5P2J3_9ACTN
MPAEPPVLLFGAQRSGTTALATVLHGAFRAAGGIFTINGKLPYLLHRWCTQADVDGRHLRADEILHALDRKPPYLPPDGWRERVETVVRAAAARVAEGAVTDAAELRRQIIAAGYAGATRWGEKYNEYLLELDALAAGAPGARWVLLIRHPAAVAESTLRWGGDRPWRPGRREGVLRKWVAWHEGWLRHPRSGDCLVLEYDRLCRGPDLRRLAQVIGLDLAPYARDLVARPGPPDGVPDDVERVWQALLDRRAAGNGRR